MNVQDFFFKKYVNKLLIGLSVSHNHLHQMIRLFQSVSEGSTLGGFEQEQMFLIRLIFDKIAPTLSRGHLLDARGFRSAVILIPDRLPCMAPLFFYSETRSNFFAMT